MQIKEVNINVQMCSVWFSCILFIFSPKESDAVTIWIRSEYYYFVVIRPGSKPIINNYGSVQFACVWFHRFRNVNSRGKPFERFSAISRDDHVKPRAICFVWRSYKYFSEENRRVGRNYIVSATADIALNTHTHTHVQTHDRHL